MNKYTVVLLRPDYLCNEIDYGKEIYVALVEANDTTSAIQAAQSEVFAADLADTLEPASPDDYALCVMFTGHCNAIRYGWQC